MRALERPGGDRKVRRTHTSAHVGSTAVIDGNRKALLLPTAAEVGRVERRAGGVEFEHEGVLPSGGVLLEGSGRGGQGREHLAGDVRIAGFVYRDGIARIIPAHPAEVPCVYEGGPVRRQPGGEDAAVVAVAPLVFIAVCTSQNRTALRVDRYARGPRVAVAVPEKIDVQERARGRVLGDKPVTDIATASALSGDVGVASGVGGDGERA